MSTKTYQLCLIAILLHTFLCVTVTEQVTQPLGQRIFTCIHDQENSHLTGGLYVTFAIINVDNTGAFTERNNDDFNEIYSIVKLLNGKLLTCGFNGIRVMNKDTGNTEIENLTTLFISTTMVIKNTEFASIAPFSQSKLIILKLEDLSQAHDVDIGLFTTRSIIQKGFTNFIYLGFHGSNNFISVDYTYLIKITLPTSVNQDNIRSIVEGNDKNHLFTIGRAAFIVKFDTIASIITKEFTTPGSIQSNRKIRIILENPIMMGISMDSGVWYLNLNTETGGLIINKPGEEYCFNPITLMVGVSELASPYNFLIYSFGAVACDDSDCTKCPFLSSMCLQCSNEKKVQEGICVQNCSDTHYYNSDLNRCLIDRCEDDEKYSFKLQRCYFCPDQKEIDLKTEKCYTCQEKNPNCDRCIPRTLECQVCKTDFVLIDKKCISRCKVLNPKCKTFDDACKCLNYECESKSCQNCPNSPKICEDYTCQQKNPNCEKCYPGTLECQKCKPDFLLADKKCNFRCKGLNPKCKKFSDDCKCLDYECETKRCQKCPNSPKICEDEEIVKKREKANDRGQRISGIIKIATPTISLISLVSLVGAGGIGSMALMSVNRIVFSKKIMYINLEKGEIFDSYMTTRNNQTQKLNEKNMISVMNMVYQYQKSIFLTLPVYIKIGLSLLITSSLLILLILVNKKASNKNFCFAVFYLKKAQVLIHTGSVSNFAFDLSFIITNIDFMKNFKNFILWMISAITLMINWVVHVKNYYYLLDLEKNDIYVPIETLSQQNFDDFEAIKLEDEKDGEKERENIQRGEIDIEKTREVIKYKNLCVIEFIRTPLRNREGFEFSKYFQAINIFRNLFFLTLIASFPNFAHITAFILMVFELQYCVTFIITMYLNECFRPINLLQNIIHSLYILFSMLIILNLHFSEKKSITLQEWLITFNYSITILEIVFTIVGGLIMIFLNAHLLKYFHKKLNRKFAFILKVCFNFIDNRPISKRKHNLAI